MTNPTELLPCECGAVPSIADEDGVTLYLRASSSEWFVRCDLCGAQSFHGTKAQATAAWNTRTPSARIIGDKDGENPVEAPSGWRLVPVEPNDAMLQAAWNTDHPNNHYAYFGALWSAMLSAAPAPVASEEVGRVEYQERPSRFSDYATSDLAAQCQMQARENLDPEYSQFMTAVSQRLLSLTTSARAVSREEVARIIVGFGPPSDNCGPATRSIWNGGLAKADAILALIGGGE